MKIYAWYLICFIFFVNFVQAEYIQSIPDDYHLIYQTPSACNENFELNAGQVLIFEVTNRNILGVNFIASASLPDGFAKDSMDTVILPYQTKIYRTKGIFSEEPIRWKITTSTRISDACIVSFNIWSTWSNQISKINDAPVPTDIIPSISDNLDIHIPIAIHKAATEIPLNLWVDFLYHGISPEGIMSWTLKNYGINEQKVIPFIPYLQPETIDVTPSLLEDYQGIWKGQTTEGEKWSIQIGLTSGHTGMIIGTVAYPSLTCGGELTLATIGDGFIELNQDITFGSCTDNLIVKLEYREVGKLYYSEIHNTSITGAGIITKINQ